MTSLPDVPTIVALRSRHIRDPAPAEEPTRSRPETMTARTMPATRMALARILRARLIAPSVRRLGASLTPARSRRERLASRSQHAGDGWALSCLRRCDYFEAVVFVERDGAGVGRLQVGGQMVGVDASEVALQQSVADSGMLAKGIDSQPRQVPVGR